MNQEEQALFLSLYYLDDYTLTQACQVNKRFYQKVCQNIWVQRIMNLAGYPDKQEIDKYMVSNYRAISGEEDIVPSYQQYYYLIKDFNPLDYPYEGIYGALKKIVGNGDVVLVKKMLDIMRENWDEWIGNGKESLSDWEIWIKKEGGYRLLRIAVELGEHIDIINLLLNLGVNVNNEYYHHVLNLAVKNNNLEVLKILLNAGAIPIYREDHEDHDREEFDHRNNPLYIALQNHSYDALKVLLENGGDKYLTPDFIRKATENTVPGYANTIGRVTPDSEVAAGALKMLSLLKVLEPYLVRMAEK